MKVIKRQGKWRNEEMTGYNSNYASNFKVNKDWILFSIGNGFRTLYIDVAKADTQVNIPLDLQRSELVFNIIIQGTNYNCVNAANSIIKSENPTYNNGIEIEYTEKPIKMIVEGDRYFVDEIQYKSLREISRVFDIKHTTVMNRMKSPKFVGWERISVRDWQLQKEIPLKIIKGIKNTYLTVKQCSENEDLSVQQVRSRLSDETNSEFTYLYNTLPRYYKVSKIINPLEEEY